MTRRLTRDQKHAVLGGVAAGFGNYFGVDPVLVRLVFILLAFLNGFGLVAYAVAWVIMPRQDETAGDSGAAAKENAPVDRLSWWYWPRWARLANLWPIIIIVIGVSLILEAARGRTRKSQ